jgi:hypothetical protein
LVTYFEMPDTFIFERRLKYETSFLLQSASP